MEPCGLAPCRLLPGLEGPRVLHDLAPAAGQLAAVAGSPRRAAGGAEAAADRAMLRQAIHERVIRLGSGVTFDFKELLTQARCAQAAGRLLWPLIRPHRPEVLVGPGFGGVPLLYAVALAALDSDGVDLALWLVRDQRKTHFRKRWVEGPCLPGRPRAVFVDDFLGRGSALALVDEALAADGRSADIRAAAVLFDHWQPLGSRQISVSRFPVVSVFKRHDIGLTRDCDDARAPLMRGSAARVVDVGQPLWWRFDFNGHSEHPYKSSPAVAEDAVFAADDQSRIWRFDGLTGEAAWCRRSLRQPHKGIVQRLQWVDRSLVVGCYDGTVTRLDSATGDIMWRWRVDSHVHATPVVDLANQRVFVNTEQSNGGEPLGHLVALDWASGRVLWRRSHAFWPPATVCHSPAHGAVIAACNDRTLTCVDAATGSLRWQARSAGLVRGQPALTATQVLVATENGILQSFDIESGAEMNQRRHGPGLLHQFLHVADGVAYVLDDVGHMVAFDAGSLELRWLGRLRGPGAWAPLPWGAHLLVLSREGHLAVFDPARQTKPWEGRVPGMYRQQPAVGRIRGQPVLACASQSSGLQVFRIHPDYDPDHPPQPA